MHRYFSDLPYFQNSPKIELNQNCCDLFWLDVCVFFFGYLFYNFFLLNGRWLKQLLNNGLREGLINRDHLSSKHLHSKYTNYHKKQNIFKYMNLDYELKRIEILLFLCFQIVIEQLNQVGELIVSFLFLCPSLLEISLDLLILHIQAIAQLLQLLIARILFFAELLFEYLPLVRRHTHFNGLLAITSWVAPVAVVV